MLYHRSSEASLLTVPLAIPILLASAFRVAGPVIRNSPLAALRSCYNCSKSVFVAILKYVISVLLLPSPIEFLASLIRFRLCVRYELIE